jgi:hypothetical protein
MSASQQKEEVVFTSFLISSIIAFLIVIVPHLGEGNKDRMFWTNSNGSSFYTYADKIASGSFKCVFGESHAIQTEGMSVSEFSSADLSFDDILKSTFEHFGLMAIITVVLTAIISILRLHENDQNKFEEIK